MGRTVITRKDIKHAHRKERSISNQNSRDSRISDDDLSPEAGYQSIDELVKKYAKPDDYITRLLKYVPSEVIVLYLTLDPLVRPANSTSQLDHVVLHWAIFICGILLTPIYLIRIQKVKKRSQLMISSLAFVVWVFAIGGPFVYLSWYKPFYGGILLPFYTTIIPLLEE